MTTATALGGALAALLLASGAGAQSGAAAVAKLQDAKGTAVGTVEFRETPSGKIWVVVTGSGLPSGKHGFHIHETGKCDASDGFKSAGGHLAGDRKHGVLHADGPHPGDLPNVTVSGDGKLEFETFIGDGPDWIGKAGLFDGDGTSVVLHAGADDYQSQPAGDSGDRIACGVISKN